jgi:hypothetical protein
MGLPPLLSLAAEVMNAIRACRVPVGAVNGSSAPEGQRTDAAMQPLATASATRRIVRACLPRNPLIPVASAPSGGRCRWCRWSSWVCPRRQPIRAGSQRTPHLLREFLRHARMISPTRRAVNHCSFAGCVPAGSCSTQAEPACSSRAAVVAGFDCPQSLRRIGMSVGGSPRGLRLPAASPGA